MREKEIERLIKKTTKIRDDLLKEKLRNYDDILKKLKKLMSKKEIEQLAVQFIVKETLSYLLENQKDEEQNPNETTEIMFG